MRLNCDVYVSANDITSTNEFTSLPQNQHNISISDLCERVANIT